MKKLLLLLCMIGHGVLVCAQVIDGDVERGRIRASRLQEEARYQIEEAACYGRFAVNDCLHGVRVRRRETLDVLRRQEQVLNDYERRQRTLEQMDRINQKLSARQIGEETTVPLQAQEVR
jgi:hypothetical protein